MISETGAVALFALLTSYWISFALTPLVRAAALRFGWVDRPTTAVKTHKDPTPCLGGVAIFAAFALTLLILRLTTNFPTGTLNRLRALLAGGVLVFVLGVLDDVTKPRGIHFKPKFAVQILAALALVFYGIRIRFVTPDYVALALTVFWVVGVTNALNIIDIMDGLAASQAAIAALAFWMIAAPSEEHYVNFASAALAGAAAGFLPWNLSRDRKMFMGDSGSMTMGYLLAGISLGTRYSDVNDLGVFAPVFIMIVPIYDTLFVMFLRMRQGLSPFLGSRDHFALRLEQMGFARPRIVVMAAAAAAAMGFVAFLVTQVSFTWAACINAVVLLEIAFVSVALARVRMR